MIERLWRGWTEPADADAYERLLREQVFADLAEEIDGYRGVRILRRETDECVEFLTAMRFESIDAVEQFAGGDYEQAHVPPEARDLLCRFDDHAEHFEIRAEIEV
ncbi:antibiotic biosynthesis monooxygenase [Halovenus sp. WSH3]|uniref:Antibiotic biosynthesis monooxygenase n=1 Tax=Halovenus carboxidivorans TaxID=2692199 RepID=A0A6B0TBT5_9EURY|nr:antibiotic biosynthesis monooxygenase [Halovenus carboxidivorans]MXR53103.1 antibiotic biosynthesis monooxygenase [Halovenus carboxidivorans]